MPKTHNTLVQKLTPEIIKSLQLRTVKQKDLAQQLQVSQTHLSRTLAELNYKRTPSPNVATRKKATLIFQARAENRQLIAQKVVEKSLDIAAAKEVANCSERTIRRYIAKLTK
jgi:transcriptional antiterminator